MDTMHFSIVDCRIRELETKIQLLEKRNDDWVWYLRDSRHKSIDSNHYKLNDEFQLKFINYVTMYNINLKKFDVDERRYFIGGIVQRIYDNLLYEQNKNIIDISFEIVKIKPSDNWGRHDCFTDDEIKLILRKVYEILTKYTKYHPQDFDKIDLKYYRKCIKELFDIDE